jgi:hypothetical protein
MPESHTQTRKVQMRSLLGKSRRQTKIMKIISMVKQLLIFFLGWEDMVTMNVLNEAEIIANV